MRHSPLLLLIGLFFGQCKKNEPPSLVVFPAPKPLVYADSILKIPTPTRKLSKSMIPTKPDSMLRVPFELPMFEAMKEQVKYLSRPDIPKYPVSGISKKEMLQTLRLLEAASVQPPGALLEYFDFYQINTELKNDRVRITGYYTPVMDVSKEPSSSNAYPLLRMPESGVPSPSAIYNGALAGRNLELGWLKSKKELRNAQLQGSCMIQFPDGDQEFLGFGGSVRGDGGAYVFFKKINKQVLGSGSFPLTAGYSAAIDPRFIPLGASLLAELPVCDKAGNVKGFQYRIIFAQDRGGAIQTTKRMDLYCGIGQKGLDAAKRVNAHGRLWLLLPKKG